MNKKLHSAIINFGHNVGEYLRLEYDPVYYSNFDKNNLHFFDFLGSYYMGGASVPDTARYVVDLILMRANET